jgi:hypothetical protein
MRGLDFKRIISVIFLLIIYLVCIPVYSFAGGAFTDYLRMSAETQKWAPLDNNETTAYFRDVWLAADTYLWASRDGDSWTLSFLLPDGTVDKNLTVTYHSLWNGLSSCFVASNGSQSCNTSWLEVWWETSLQCRPTGLWKIKLTQNGQELVSKDITVLPRIQPGLVPLFNQGNYNDINIESHYYDSICRTIKPDGTLAKDVFMCGTKQNEYPG